MQKKSIVSLTALFALCFSLSAKAATITPTIFDDAFGGMNCSLRNAIQSINDGVEFGGCVNTGAAFGTEDTITLQAGTYNLTIAGNTEDDNQTGDLDVLPDVANITISGAGSDQTIIDASGIVDNDRVIEFQEGVETANISGIQITGGDVSELGQFGGGILSSALALNLNDVHILNNFSNAGGGILATCSLNIINSSIEGNEVVESFGGLGGGGIFIFQQDFCSIGSSNIIESSSIINNNADQLGGGLFSDAEFIAIRNSTISGNGALEGAGGGIFDFSDYLFLTNTTVSNNEAAQAGGGIASTGGLKGMYNVTIANNEVLQAGGQGGGVLREGGLVGDERFQIQVYNTIIANNTADVAPDCIGVFGSGGNNLIGNIGAAGQCNTFAAAGDQVGTPGNPIDPQLEPLQLNGGTTQTRALALTSPAVDMGNNMVGCQALDTALFFDTDVIQFNTLTGDQRSLLRPVAILDPATPICDIGAFELQAVTDETPPNNTPPADQPPVGVDPQANDDGNYVEGSGCSLNPQADFSGSFMIGLLALFGMLVGLRVQQRSRS